MVGPPDEGVRLSNSFHPLSYPILSCLSSPIICGPILVLPTGILSYTTMSYPVSCRWMLSL